MKLIIFILTLVVSIFSQNTTYKDGTNCKCDYILYEYYNSGVLHKEIPIINNDTLGWVITYWPDEGNKIYEKSYYDHIGIVESFFYNTESGNIMRHYIFSSLWDEISIDTAWYRNGQVESISSHEYNNKNYKCDSWRINNFTRYYENGKVKEQRSGLTSKCIQTQKLFYDNGNIAGIITYKNGEFISNKCADGRFGNESLDCLK